MKRTTRASQTRLKRHVELGQIIAIGSSARAGGVSGARREFNAKAQRRQAAKGSAGGAASW